MAFNYLNMQETANRLITNFGANSVLRKVSNSGTAYAPTLSEVDYDIKAVVTDYSKSDIDGTHILRSDKRILVKVGSLEILPEVNDKIVIDSKEYKIMDINEIKPANIVIYWEIQGRNG